MDVIFLVAGMMSQRLRSLESGVCDGTTPQVDPASLEAVESRETPAVVLCALRLIRRGNSEMLLGVIPLRRDPALSASGREAVIGRDQFTGHDECRADRPPDVGAQVGDDHHRTTAAVAPQLDAGAMEARRPHHRDLLLRIDSFVHQRLHDASLSPAVIAEAHHISVSHLHRLFRSRGVTVAAWIRRQRLERARRDLGDPALRDVPVHRIAARWGFTGHSTFTRAFRAAYGTAPQQVRLAGDGPP